MTLFKISLSIIITFLSISLMSCQRDPHVDKQSVYQAQLVAEEESNDVEDLQELAEMGDALAQHNLGVIYEQGKGVEQDYTKAVEWFTKAAEQNNADAQYNLGLMYIKGEGVKSNSINAKEWFKKSCENGNKIGCDNYYSLSEL